jgi:hypothetical protein
MSQLEKSPTSIQDDRLAEFTNQALAGRINQAEADVDADLLALEETVIRLKTAFPPAALDQAAIKQMQARFNTRARREAQEEKQPIKGVFDVIEARVRRETQEEKQPFWKKWFEPQSRLQFGMAVATMALLIAFAVFSPLSITGGSSTSATALTPVKNIFMAVALAGFVLIFLWIRRRK